MKYYALSFMLLCICHLSNAQEPGQLDESFGNDGITKFDFKPTTQFFPKIAQQKDGGIVAYMQLNFDTLIIYRFLKEGVLDSTFGINGSVVTIGNRGVGSIGVQKDNSIIVFGSVNGESVIRRFTSTGKVDSSFGENGLVPYTFGGFIQSVTDFASTADDKIVTVGTFSESGNRSNILVARFNPDGSIDSSFGEEGGKTIIEKGVYGYAIGLQKNGNIIVGGDDLERFVVARLTPDGIIDSSFGNNGVTVTDFDQDDDYINNITIQPDDKIIAVGVALVNNLQNKKPYMAIARYMPNGVLDPKFGAGGKVKQRFDDYSEAFGVALQNNGKIIVSGFVSKLAGNAALARYESNGILDSSFGENGVTITDFGTNQDQGYDVVVQPSGRIVVRCTPGLILAGYTNDDRLGIITKIRRWIRRNTFHFSDDNGGTASYYIIEQQNSSAGFIPVARIASNNSNNYSYDISNLTSSSTITNFRIKAIYADGAVAYSDAITASVLQVDSKVSISPNPASSIIHIAVKEKTLQDGTIYLHDAMGNLVRSQSFAKQTKISINISNLRQGHYRVVVNSNGVIAEGGFLKE